MNGRLSLVALATLAIYSLVPGVTSSRPLLGAYRENSVWERDEIKQSYELAPGARVSVASISGPVEIETSSGSTAEVHVVRSARNPADLQYHRVIIEHSANSLTVRGEQEQGTARGVQVNQHVMLKLPVNVDLNVNSISGHAIVGDIGGHAHINSISGPVTIGDVSGEAVVTSVSGRLSIGTAGGQVHVREMSGRGGWGR